MSSRAAEQQSSRAAEQQSSRAAEQQSSRAAEQQSSRAAEQQSSRAAEQQSSRAAELWSVMTRPLFNRISDFPSLGVSQPFLVFVLVLDTVDVFRRPHGHCNSSALYVPCFCLMLLRSSFLGPHGSLLVSMRSESSLCTRFASPSVLALFLWACVYKNIKKKKLFFAVRSPPTTAFWMTFLYWSSLRCRWFSSSFCFFPSMLVFLLCGCWRVCCCIVSGTFVALSGSWLCCDSSFYFSVQAVFSHLWLPSARCPRFAAAVSHVFFFAFFFFAAVCPWVVPGSSLSLPLSNLWTLLIFEILSFAVCLLPSLGSCISASVCSSSLASWVFEPVISSSVLSCLV